MESKKHSFSEAGKLLRDLKHTRTPSKTNESLRNVPLEVNNPTLGMPFFLIPTQELFFSLLLEREKGRERNFNAKEKHKLVASQYSQTRDPTCPNQGSQVPMPGQGIGPTT